MTSNIHYEARGILATEHTGEGTIRIIGRTPNDYVRWVVVRVGWNEQGQRFTEYVETFEKLAHPDAEQLAIKLAAELNATLDLKP